MGTVLIFAAYAVYAAFWLRFAMHALVWWRAKRRLEGSMTTSRPGFKACALSASDIVLFGRLFMMNPALWLGEWVFHASLFLVLLRHLRYFLDPVPGWVWSMQTPGLIAGYILPLALAYVLVVRLLAEKVRYASAANVFLLALVLMISSIGLLMRLWFLPNLVDVKLFALGLLCFKPGTLPGSLWFALHFGLVLVLVLFLPTHIFTAPLVMIEARKREQQLRLVMHDRE
jgi:nitrate reductase gamma subunit